MHKETAADRLFPLAFGRIGGIGAAILGAIWLLTVSVSAQNFGQSQDAALITYSLAVDGHVLQPSTDLSQGVNRLEPGAHRLQIGFSTPFDNHDSPLRLRYRLQGLESDWQEAGGEMRISILFETADLQTVGSENFLVHGESDGWGGSVETSHFSPHRERVVVPPGARLLQVKMTSGGPPETVGLIAIKNLKVFQTESNPNHTNSWPYAEIAFAMNTNHSPGNLIGWSPGGFPSRMARTLSLPDGATALAIFDNSPTGYAEWVSDLTDLIPKMQPGETLEVQWQELYTVGASGGASIEYSYVPPGKYTFQVDAVSLLGKELGKLSGVSIVIPEFFWATRWFVLLLSAVLAGALACGVRYVTRRRMQRRLERLEYQRAVQRERERIARDIHDNLGANLAQIAMLSELAQADLHQPEWARERLNKIFDTSRGLARQLDETVWAINPAHDSLEDVVSFLGNFAQEYFRLAGIRCRFDMPEDLPRLVLTSAIRHNLFLAAKEALQNVAKHSHASEVWLRLQLRGKDLALVIEDNGQGLATMPGWPNSRPSGGNGLTNIQRRLQQIGGRFELQSKPGEGTSVGLILVDVLKMSRDNQMEAPDELKS